MKKLIVSSLASLLLLASPVATLAKDPVAKEADAEKDGKKNITVATIAATPEAVHQAALQALAAVGAEIKKDTPLAIEAKRPNKIGLAVGSGGEKLFVEIKAVAEGKTELKVSTKKTLMGIAGQKLWNDEVAKQVSEALK